MPELGHEGDNAPHGLPANIHLLGPSQYAPLPTQVHISGAVGFIVVDVVVVVGEEVVDGGAAVVGLDVVSEQAD